MEKLVPAIRAAAECWVGIAAHQDAVANRQRDMHDALLGLVRDAHVGRTVAEGLQFREVAAEDGTIELEGLAAVGFEGEIGVQGHCDLLRTLNVSLRHVIGMASEIELRRIPG